MSYRPGSTGLVTANPICVSGSYILPMEQKKTAPMGGSDFIINRIYISKPKIWAFTGFPGVVVSKYQIWIL